MQLLMCNHTFPGLFFALSLNISNDGFALCLQAKRAVQRGATAVIFDVSENPDAIDQVCAHLKLPGRPRSHVPAAAPSRSNLSRSVCESSAACPALLTGGACVLFVQTMIFLSLVLFKSMWISLAHSTILGL